MDVVSDAGSIRSWIICPKNLNLRTTAGSSLKCKRNQVRFRVVILSEFGFCISSRRIEVTQRKIFQSIRFMKPVHCTLKSEFGFAVRIYRILRVVFGNGHLLRHAVSRTCRRKDQKFHATFFHGLQQVQTTNQVCVVIRFRLLGGFGDQRFACEMEHAFNRIFTKSLVEIREITDVSLEGWCAFNKGSMTGGKVIENDRRKPGCLELLYGMTADIASTASDKYHDASFRKYSTVNRRPCSIPTSGRHPSILLARAMFGHRNRGSSTGSSRVSIGLELPVK